jgi:hypothetical protein
MPAVKREKRIEPRLLMHTVFSWKGGIMTTRKNRVRRPARPMADVLARPRELFGESLPELLLVAAVVAAVVSGVFSLNGGI